MTLRRCTVETPLGPLWAHVTNDGAVVSLDWRPRFEPTSEAPPQLVTELDEYFDGRRAAFTLPLRPPGTEFQTAVWTLVGAIPYGETSTYQAIATALGRQAAARAVGQANARNPISVIIPCHRVLGSTGNLRGYAGGLATKRALLGLEARASHLHADG